MLGYLKQNQMVIRASEAVVKHRLEWQRHNNIQNGSHGDEKLWFSSIFDFLLRTSIDFFL